MNICIVGATGNVGRKILDVLDKKKQVKEYENQFGTMINTYGEQVFGNMLILKTYTPNNKDKSMVLDNQYNVELI